MNFKFYLLPLALVGLALSPIRSLGEVFGPTDTRQELYQIPVEWKSIAQATVAMVPMQKFGRISAHQWKTFLNGTSLKNSPNFNPPVNPAHPFANQPLIADCSGFLVAPDVVVTASHCIPEDGNVNGMYFYFVAGLGYESSNACQTSPLDITVSDDQVSTVKEVLFQGTPSGRRISNNDYAILRLKKPLFGVTPLALKTNQPVMYPNPVAAFFYPLGVPLKGDLSGRVAENANLTDKIILTFYDSGEGGSGGPVIDPVTKGVFAMHLENSTDWLECDSGNDDWVTWQCESHRPETVAEIESDPTQSRRTKRQFRRWYPSGVITTFANHDLKIDQIADKLTELKISFKKL